MALLMSPKIIGNPALDVVIDLIRIVHHQNVFGGDGTIGLKLKTPISILMLKSKQGFSRFPGRFFDRLKKEGLIVYRCDFGPFGDHLQCWKKRSHVLKN